MVGIRREYLILPLDALVVFLAYLTTLVLRFEGEVSLVYWHGFWLFIPFALAVHLVANYGFRLYGRSAVIRARRVVLGGVVAGFIVVGVAGWLWQPRRPMPLSVLVFGAALCILGLAAVRLLGRSVPHSSFLLWTSAADREELSALGDKIAEVMRAVRKLLGPTLLAATLGAGVLLLLVILRQRT